MQLIILTGQNYQHVKDEINKSFAREGLQNSKAVNNLLKKFFAND